MRNTAAFLSILGLAGCLCASAPAAGKNTAPDVTSKLEDLGSPYKAKYPGGASIYARNIWTMKAYQGKLFLGAGNSANGGPASNAGPVPVIVLDPATKKYTTEWSVPDEQIETYRVFSDGLLYIPGHDPKEDWKLGNFYRRQKDGKWEKVRTYPDGVHMYDLAELDHQIFACGYTIAASKDRGKTFQPFKQTAGRVYSFLTFPDRLVAPGFGTAYSKEQFKAMRARMKGAGRNSVSPVSWTLLSYTPGKKELTVIARDKSRLIPEDLDRGGAVKASKAKSFQDKVIYIFGFEHNDHQIIPYAAMVTKSDLNAVRIPLAENERPWDTLVTDDGKVYLLTETMPANENEKTIVTVYQIQTRSSGKVSVTAKPVLSFKATTFARSFERIGNYFYFGMGTEIKPNMDAPAAPFQAKKQQPPKWTQSDLKEECGQIYRVEVPQK